MSALPYMYRSMQHIHEVSTGAMKWVLDPKIGVKEDYEPPCGC